MRISIFGMGYVGCVSMGCLAQMGHKVIGVDINATKIDAINQGTSPIVEKDIEDVIGTQRSSGNIEATDDFFYAVKESDVSFICVGTPSTPDGHLNLGAIFRVFEQIAVALASKDSFHIIVIRSTVLPGTNELVVSKVEKASGKKKDKDFTIVSNPEFLREGSAIADYYNPPFTLVGSSHSKALSVMKEIYDAVDAPFIEADVKVAEIMKYVNNSFHAQKVVFANEVGNICKRIGIDSREVMEIFCLDKKLNLSPYYLKPGFAYGGSCLPKDLKALKTIAHDQYLACHLIDSIERSNENQIELVFNQIMDFNVPSLGFLGLSFKADTDDLRNSPILDIIERLLGKGIGVKIYDKNVLLSQLTGANKEYILNKIPYISKFVTDNYEEVVNSSQAIVIVNKSSEFRDILSGVPQDTIIYDLVDMEFEGRDNHKNYIGISW